ncbi:deaminase [Streptomyces sp. Ru71]|uniref:dihydrofolate reductase family protein n=1 Tax=Streptomyces sp. Ru71 TaxID=2080746 RepID=UPI000CDDF0C1|nr:dihydrofolate reductase family protein [Streptomyces sp. Ru71]POX56140.1 deaminase [Streptomyces sp. Ru71]
MRTVASEFISLDGVVQAPGEPEDTDDDFAHGGWSLPYVDPEVVGGAFEGALAKADALLCGERTWQTMATLWPERAGEIFADRMNAVRAYVVSGTLVESDLPWPNMRLIPAGEAMDRIEDLRATPGGDLLIAGSPRLVRSLLTEGLLDELILMRMPVLLGGGMSIFPADGVRRPFQLVSTVSAKTGAEVCVYRAVAQE